MECHYCESGADIVVENGGIKVGVCEQHFREQMDELAEAKWLDDLEDELDVDRAE
jgi:hypothetical protein